MNVRGLAWVALVVATGTAAACSGGAPAPAPDESALDATAPSVGGRSAPAAARPMPPQVPNYFAGPADTSKSVVQHDMRVTVSEPFASRPLRDLPDMSTFAHVADDDEEDRFEHAPGLSGKLFPQDESAVDPVVQKTRGRIEMPMPATLQNFLGQGQTMGNCIFPKPDSGEPAKCTTLGDPPDTEGAVGPNNYVQIVNSGIAIWNKTGTLVTGPKYTSTLFMGIPTTDGNNCGGAPPNGDDGDGVVLYDQMADRWIFTQFDLTNYIKSGTGPSYQCVAVSQTGDPSGPYWLYDFKYTSAINDYGKFSVWPDAYYASYNDFNPTFTGANLCAWDRNAMLTGATAKQVCFGNSGFGFLPVSVDGAIKPPVGEPGFFVTLESGTSIGLYKFHADFTTTTNSTFTGPTTLPVAAYTQLCNGGNCVAQPAPGNALASLGDRPMFHAGYRNFGALESLTFNHSVRNGTNGGVRWYEIRSPNGTPSVFQQGTYVGTDGNYRWMASMAQDQAEDMALGFSVSGATHDPSISWTGRLVTDAVGTMGQAEAAVFAGGGVETGTFSNGQTAARWGDYSNMTVDPTDDCTFWYTQEVFPANGIFNWDTRVSSVAFPECAANDFGITATPSPQNVMQGQSVNYTIATTLKKGTAESIALYIQDLPTGVTAAFVPPTVTAGASSVLTLTTTATTPLTASPDTFTVIGKAPSAVHAATAVVSVVACVPLTVCPAGDNCGSLSNGCGGMITCGGACTAIDACHTAGTCTANVCSNPVGNNGGTCNDGNACTTGDVCNAGTCAGTPVVCTNGDQCNNAGTCQAGTGMCSNPTPKAGGTTCNDNNACTSNDVCTNGSCAGTAVVCMNGDACHTAGTCEADGGTCSSAVQKPNGTACTGGTCQSGTCVPTVVDSGAPDSGAKDSGTGSTDSGSGGSDSGTAHDSGSTGNDSGSVSGGDGSAEDGAIGDATAEGGGGGNSGNNGGCGCTTVGTDDRTPLGLAGLGGLALLMGIRRRRRAA